MTGTSPRDVGEIPAILLSWDYHEGYACSPDSGLSDATRASAAGAVRRLRTIFGDDWLVVAVREYHPLVRLLRDRMLFNFVWLAEFVDAMVSVQVVPGAEDLINRLARGADWTAAWSELDLASRLSENNCQVTLSPLVSNVRPDIRVEGETPIYIEVTGVHPGSDPAIDTLHDLLPAIMAVDGRVAVSGRVRSGIPRRQRPFIRERIKDRALDAEQAGEQRNLVGREFALSFVPRDLLQNCAPAFREAACGGISARASRATPIDRIARRFAEEAEQIPSAAQGIIVLYDFIGAEETWFPYIVERLTNEMAELPKISAAVYITRHALRDVPCVGIEETSFGWMLRRPVILPVPFLDWDPRRPRIGRETALVIRNERAGRAFDPDVLLRGLRTHRLAL